MFHCTSRTTMMRARSASLISIFVPNRSEHTSRSTRSSDPFSSEICFLSKRWIGSTSALLRDERRQSSPPPRNQNPAVVLNRRIVELGRQQKWEFLIGTLIQRAEELEQCQFGHAHKSAWAYTVVGQDGSSFPRSSTGLGHTH